MDTNFISENENKENTTKKFFLFLALPVVGGFCWFCGSILSTNRRLQIYDEIYNSSNQPGTAAEPFSCIEPKQLNQNNVCSWGSGKNELFDSWVNEVSEISEISRNDFSVTDGSESTKSANTILRIRGGGSGDASKSAESVESVDTISRVRGGADLSTVSGRAGGRVPASGLSPASRNAPGRLSRRPSSAPSLGRRPSTGGTPRVISSGAGLSSAGGANFSGTPLRSTQSSAAELMDVTSSSNQNIPGGTRPSRSRRCLQAIVNCCGTGTEASVTGTDQNQAYVPAASVPAYERPFEAPWPQQIEKNPYSPIEQYRDEDVLHYTYDSKLQNLVLPNKTFGVICEPRIEKARITKNFDGYKFGRQVFLNCALGENRDTCSAALQDEINTMNAAQKLTNPSSPPFVLYESSLEAEGLQARFSLPYQNKKNGPTELVEVIVYGEKNKEGDITNVNVVPVSEILYNEKKDLLNKIKPHRDAILKTLPKLGVVNEKNWQLQTNHDYDHYIGSNDAANIGIFHERSATQYMPSPFNQSRPMDHEKTDKGVSTKFKTNLVEDTLNEFRHLFDPFRDDNPYKNSTETSTMPESVKVQQESAAAEKFQDSTHYIEKKERIFRADLRSLGDFSNEQVQEYGLQKLRDEASQEEHVIFQSQKLSKAQKNSSIIISDMLAILDTNYKLRDPSVLPRILPLFEKSYVAMTTLGEIESNLLGLSRGHDETKCALDNLRVDMKSKQDALVNAMVQFNAHNGTTVTHEEVHAKMDSIRTDIVNDSIIHDPKTFAEKMDQASQIIERHGLDRNNLDRKRGIFPEKSELRRHAKVFQKDEITQVRNETPGITGHIVPGLRKIKPVGPQGPPPGAYN